MPEAENRQFADSIGTCAEAITAYRLNRSELVRTYQDLQNVDGGPWRAKCGRKTLNGDISIKGRAIDLTSDGMLSGPAVAKDKNPYAPLLDFKLIDLLGNAPANGTPPFKIQQRMLHFMEEIRVAAQSLVTLLPQLETVAPTLGVDPVALTQLRHRLPGFPYIPVREQATDLTTSEGSAMKFQSAPPGFTTAEREKVVAEDGPFLDRAMVALDHLHQAHWRMQQSTSTKETRSVAQPMADNAANGSRVNWLYQIVKEGRKTAIGKLAYGLLLLGTSAAFIALVFRYNFKYAFFSMVAIIPLAGVVLTLSWAQEHGKKDARPFYLAFLVICLMAFTVIVGLSISVTFFGVPEVGASHIFGR
ncbi:MAG: hypothetical protein JWL69_1036 [Phycisphaerales bacterium]|nr:hypothetical protein [Phycisphaerales bacterium]MDB5357002.1 hypothetical protein [Phycisphaerales bacterium]